MITHFLFSTLISVLSFKAELKDSVPTAKVDAEVLTKLVNKVRAQGCNCGDAYYKPVVPLKWNGQLATVAQAHASDMVSNHFFSHTSSKGQNAGERLAAAGYSWKSYGENIAMGHASEEEVIEGWIKSPGHCKNLMGESFTEFGVGRSGVYWAMELASK